MRVGALSVTTFMALDEIFFQILAIETRHDTSNCIYTKDGM